MTARQQEPETSGTSTRLSSGEVEMARRQRANELNSNPGSGPQLQARYGQVWNPDELARDFETIGFATPYVVVRRRSDGALGSLEFQHHPRFYFNFEFDQAA